VAPSAAETALDVDAPAAAHSLGELRGRILGVAAAGCLHGGSDTRGHGGEIGRRKGKKESDVASLQHPNGIVAVTLVGNLTQTNYLFGVSSWLPRSVRSPGHSPPVRTAR
jgi:hypothetical protein